RADGLGLVQAARRSSAGRCAASGIAPQRSTRGPSPVPSTSVLGCSPPASPPEITPTRGSAPHTRRAAARVRAGGAPLALQLVAVSGPAPASSPRAASSPPTRGGGQRTPPAPASRALPPANPDPPRSTTASRPR